jgi:hypothetical protein
MIHELDVVRLLRSIPGSSVPVGAVGAVVIVYENGAAYEVEFCDPDGATIGLLTLRPQDIEKVEPK